MSAGDSARRLASQYEREAARLLELARRYRQGADGEDIIAAVLRPLAEHGWVVLEDRQAWSGSTANINLIAVGPGGVVVIDAKNWQQPPDVRAGTLWCADLECTAQVRSLAQTAARVAAVLETAGVSPLAVRAVMAFVHHTISDCIGQVNLVGAGELALALETPVVRFTADKVHDIVERLAKAFPGYAPRRQVDTPDAAGPGARLFAVHQELAELAVTVRLGPIEDWMTYLHPEQLDLVRAQWSGPARISGPAGTGKTVVGYTAPPTWQAATRARSC